MTPRTIDSKRVTPDEALARTAGWRAAAERVVFTSGRFDLLGVGHARRIASARANGDRLVVIVRGDERGEIAGGSVLPAEERASLVAALSAVDLVVVLDDSEAAAFCARLRADAELSVEDADGRSSAEQVERVRARHRR